MKWSKVSGRVAIVVAALLSIAAVSGCAGSDDATAEGGGGPVEVAIGTQPWIGYGPFWIAEEKGFDKAHGVDLKLVNFSTDQDLESGFASGRFQAANAANNTFIRLADLGIDFTIPMMEDFSLQADAIVSCKPGIRSIRDLAGAKVAFEEHSVSDVLFRYALKQAGVGFDTIDYVSIPAADAGAAAVAGRVDVAVTYEPYLQAALEKGEGCKVIYTANERPGLISDALGFSAEFAKSNPQAVIGVLKAWGDAVDFYNSNTDEARAIIAKAVGETPEALGPSFDGIKLYNLKESNGFLAADYEPLWNDIRAIMKDQGQLKSEPSSGDYVDTSFGVKALAAGGS